MAQKKIWVDELKCWIYIDENQDEQATIIRFITKVKESKNPQIGNYKKKDENL